MKDPKESLGGPCPICGHKIEYKGSTLAAMYSVHKCPPRTLHAINAADSRAYEPVNIVDPSNRALHERLREGFRMMGDACNA